MRTVLKVTGVAVLMLAALALAACDDDDDTDGASPTQGATGTRTPAGSASATAGPFEGGRDPVEGAGLGATPSPAGQCMLVDVRAGEQAGFDRAVFEFENCLPGYRVQYEDEAVACGSGEIEDAAGNAILEVRFEPAAAHNEAGMTTVPSLELMPGLNEIVELDSTCDFEGVVVWAIGLTSEADFRVSALTDPFRLVVDVQTP